MSEAAEWRSTVGQRQTSPFKSNDVPLLRIPGMRPSLIATDPLHTFHLGWGADLAASGLLMLAKLGYFGSGGLDARLGQAYEYFLQFCKSEGRSTSCDNFAKRDFDMS